MTESPVEVLPPCMDLNATVSELAPRLLRYCLGRSGSPDLAEDAAQDALSVLVQRCRSGNPPDHAEAFVFTVARRRLARRQWQSRWLEPLDVLLGRPSSRADPERLTAGRATLGITRAGLSRLKPKLREALLLVAVGEMSITDASKVLGVSNSAVKMRVSRARQQLQVYLAAQEPSVAAEGTAAETAEEVESYDHAAT